MRPVSDGKPARRDPAPTRLAYRMNRLWLTPIVRALLRVGLPAFCIVFAAGWYFSDAARRAAVAGVYLDLRAALEERPEFSVKLLAVEGASTELDEDIREVLPLDFPVSSFDLDLEAMRRTVSGLDAVAKAELRIRPGGILQIIVVERDPAVIWRGRGGLELLDAAGHRVAPLGARTNRSDLPVIAGDGAYEHVAEALALFAAARPIADRVRGLVRMGERRWDLVLDRDQRILLPEDGALAALERVMALHVAEDMLERDLIAIDLRNAARPTLRMAPGAVDELRRIKTLEAGANNG